MTQDEIDTMWQKAMQESIKDGEMFTRYHFAKLVAEAEREACASILDANAMACESHIMRSLLQSNAQAIRVRGQA
jgi:hypothetical protein